MNKLYVLVLVWAVCVAAPAQTVYKSTFSSGNKSASIMLTQSSFELSSNDTVLSVEVTSNVNFQVIPKVSWIQLLKVRNGHLVFKVSQNKGDLSRSGTVDVSNVSGTVKKTIQFAQANYVNGDYRFVVFGGSASDAQPGNEFKYSYDGNLSTLYHSSWSGGTLPVTLIYNFVNVPRIDYMIYTPRASNTGSNGNFNAIDVYYKLSGSSTYVKFNSFTLNGASTPYKITFTDGLIKPTSIKIVVNSGTGNFASCAEMQFFAVNKSFIYKELKYSNIENRAITSWLKAGGTRPDGETLNVNSLYWTKNSKPWLPVMGEFHYVRYPRSGWEDEILKMKAAGISIVSTYVFWVNHEQPQGTWSWTGDNDLHYFIELCKKHGMYLWLRPGPYINAEAKNGGFPDWINSLSGKRSDAPGYIAEVRKYYSQVVKQTKGLFYKDGGPIIGVQIENEFANGDPNHMSTLLKIAQDSGMVAPFYSVTNNSKCNYQNGDLLPMQGAYPYRGWGAPQTPSADFLYSTDEWNAMENIGGLPYDGTKFPRGMAEMGVACWQSYGARFIVPVYGSEGHLQNCIGRGINLAGYYMFQGGTQKSGFEGGGQPLNYDFQAPLGEYGEVRPSYSALKLIHHFLNDFGEQLAPMQPLRPENMILNPTDTTKLRYCGRFLNDSGFVFLTDVQNWVQMPPKKDVQFKLKLKSDTLVFPLKPFTLNSNLAPIFPVNFNCNGSLLKYSTSQLLCKIMSNNVPHYFFFAIDGITPEFGFDGSTVTTISTSGKKVSVGKNTVVFPVPSLNGAITVTAKDGRQAVIVLLTRSQAEQSWRLKFRSEERLFISDANLLIDGDSMEVSTKKTSANVYSFPQIATPFSGEAITSEGLFSKHSLSFNNVPLSITVTKVSNQISTFPVITSLPTGVKDVFANINYIGAKGDVFIDNVKYSDDYYNGNGWDIGLKRFINGNSRTVKIVATKWDSSVTGVAVDKQPKNSTESAGLVKGITFEPEYFIRFK